MKEIRAGDKFAVSYPFWLGETYDWAAGTAKLVDTWNPGVTFQPTGPETSEGFANGMGKMHLTVVDVYRPGDWPTRVFYTRKWEDPNGKIFGKNRLHIKALGNFRGLLRGYRHRFILDKAA